MRSALSNRAARRNALGKSQAELTKDTPLSSKIVEAELGTTFSSEQSCIILPGHPSRAELRKRNFMKTYPQSRVAEGEFCEDISPRGGTSRRHTPRAELLKWNFGKTYPPEWSCGITPKAELRKWNFVKTFPLELSCGGRTSRRHIPRAELPKWNFGKSYPLEQSCGSGTSP